MPAPPALRHANGRFLPRRGLSSAAYRHPAACARPAGGRRRYAPCGNARGHARASCPAARKRTISAPARAFLCRLSASGSLFMPRRGPLPVCALRECTGPCPHLLPCGTQTGDFCPGEGFPLLLIGTRRPVRAPQGPAAGMRPAGMHGAMPAPPALRHANGQFPPRRGLSSAARRHPAACARPAGGPLLVCALRECTGHARTSCPAARKRAISAPAKAFLPLLIGTRRPVRAPQGPAASRKSLFTGCRRWPHRQLLL